MNNRFKNAGHLVRVGLVFVAGSIAFFVLRGLIVPQSFGQYGHYRGNFIDEAAAKPVVFAGREACAACHSDIVEAKKAGKHANVGCEACHGPLARHADDPSALVPKKPDTAVLCVRCHEANPAKPKGFPQVASKDHSGGVACGSCHQPHNPKIG